LSDSAADRRGQQLGGRHRWGSWLQLLLPALLFWSSVLEAASEAPVLLYGTNLWGELEACGCMTDHLGGLTRRATVIKRERAVRPTLLVETGNTLLKTRLIPVGEEKVYLTQAERVLNQLRPLALDALLPGPFDLINYMPLLEASALPLVCANLLRKHPGPSPWVAVRRVKLGPFSVALTGLLSPGTLLPEQYLVSSPQEALNALPLGGPCDVVILLSGLSADELDHLERPANLAGIPILIVNATGERKLDVPLLHDGMFVLEAGTRGRYFGKLILRANAAQGLLTDRSQAVRLQQEVQFWREELDRYRRQAIAEGVKDDWTEIGRFFARDPVAAVDLENLHRRVKDFEQLLTALPSPEGEGLINEVLPLSMGIPEDPAMRGETSR